MLRHQEEGEEEAMGQSERSWRNSSPAGFATRRCLCRITSATAGSGGLGPFITSGAFAAPGSIGYALIYPIAVPGAGRHKAPDGTDRDRRRLSRRGTQRRQAGPRFAGQDADRGGGRNHTTGKANPLEVGPREGVAPCRNPAL